MSLVALLLPALTRAKEIAKRTVCLNNLKQINIGLRMYADDSNDTSPWVGQTTNRILAYCYKELIKDYVGLNGPASSHDKLFACPSDTFYYNVVGRVYVSSPRHDNPAADYSSYGFNGANQFTNVPTLASGPLPGIGGLKLCEIKHPAKTALVFEAPAYFPYSWHQPKHPLPVGSEMPMFNDAKDVVSFVDGHVSYINIYWNTNLVTYPGGRFATLAIFYDPPPGYEYQWSAD